MLWNIDPDRYSYIDLTYVCQNALNYKFDGLNVMIVLSCNIPGTMKRMDVDVDHVRE